MEIRPILSALLRNKTAPILVAMQVAISLAILANALYVVNLRMATATRPSGIGSESEVFRIDSMALKEHPFNERVAQQKAAMAVLKAIPGVVSVAATNQMPMARSSRMASIAVDRKQREPTAMAAIYFTPDALITTLGLKLEEGRDFVAADVLEEDAAVSRANPEGVIVTHALAQKMYPGAASVIGKPMLFGTGDDADEVHIIGVVERLQTPNAEPEAKGEYSAILPMRTATGTAQFAVRTQVGERDRVIGEAEAALRKVSADLVVVSSTSTEKDRANRYSNDRALAWMLVGVCTLLLLITAGGIVGMTSLWVAQRKKQIGVRRALGARKVDILRYFLTENILITSGGIAIGLVLAIGLNQFLVRQLDLGKLPQQFLLFGAVVFWLLGIAAVIGPALRAVRISPALATRSV